LHPGGSWGSARSGTRSSSSGRTEYHELIFAEDSFRDEIVFLLVGLMGTTGTVA
jgi:hypothetical protein